MNLYFLGGAMEIGGSCIYIKIAGKNILLDCGIRQTTTKDPIPDFCTIQEQGGLDAIIISHAHMDHIGTLPMISKAYPQARIYMTAMTADLTRVLLYDSLKIMRYKEDEIPHYSEQDVLAMLNRIVPIGFQRPFELFDGFSLTFYPAGHIAGAACVYLVTTDGSLFYSGDFSSFPQRTIEGIRIPKLRPDVSIVETTYGNRLHANRQAEEKRLVDLVKECILENKKVLIPAFALGRAQEVLLILRAAIQNKEIPAVPLYVDGMVRDINIMYTRNPTYLRNTLGKRVLKGNEPFYTKEIQPVAPMQNREELLNTTGPLILLASSGMLTGGPSSQYASLLAPSENACIIITGYQDEESPGRQLLNLLEPVGGTDTQLQTGTPANNAARSLLINGVTVPVKCRIEQVGLSAHGDKSEIISLLERLSSRHVFLVHGNQDVINELGTQLAQEDYRRNIYLPDCGQAYEISLRSKRKQLLFQPLNTMQMDRAFTKEDEKQFWGYWQEHYLGKSFSIPQLAHIWYGKPANYLGHSDTETAIQADEAIHENMQKIFLNSPYFSANTQRLFLFQANTPENAAQALAPKELTIQELEVHVQKLFQETGYRKISYHSSRKEVVLQFDYPDSQDMQAFQKKAEQFHTATGWDIAIHPSMNHNAASILLSMLFGDRISKTSYYTDKKCYAVTLVDRKPDSPNLLTAQPLTDLQAAEKFYQETGWTLLVNGQRLDRQEVHGQPAITAVYETSQDSFIIPANANATAMEQNLALQHIDQAFASQPHKPDKKSLKTDAKGKYLEISFISPFIGQKYRKVLQALASQTGWRIRIADKINQNALTKTAQMLCINYGLTLAKNPSYLPNEKAVQLKLLEQADADGMQKLMDEFLKLTGCRCRFIH